MKLAIKDELGPFKPINEINYEDLKSVIINAVKQRLMEFNNSNTENIIKELLNQLTEKQSLLTMGKV